MIIKTKFNIGDDVYLRKDAIMGIVPLAIDAFEVKSVDVNCSGEDQDQVVNIHYSLLTSGDRQHRQSREEGELVDQVEAHQLALEYHKNALKDLSSKSKKEQ